MKKVRINQLSKHVGESVLIEGWLYNKRSSGKLQFPIIRDGSGYTQGVLSKKEVDEAAWNAADEATQESTVRVVGTVREEPRAPGGHELHLSSFELVSKAAEYPITPKEHGTAFLMDLRHLWLRSSKQHAVLKVRNEVEQSCRDFFYERDFVLIDSPILTPAACEGTSTLFETDYFGEKAYLSQSGQLYLEPAAAAFGKVYCFGPTFRAEKSKTRRHLMEFWMVEPEVAFLEFDGLQDLAEEFVEYIVGRTMDRCREELKVLERDVSRLEKVVRPFPRVSYREAIEVLQKKGMSVQFGDDLGGDEETALAEAFEQPVIVSRYRRRSRRSTCSPTRRTRSSPWAWTCLPPRGTERSSAARSASTITICSSSGSASTTSPSTRSSGISTSGSTARFPIRASEWASSG
jgi:asparaginyl-tRNA synthetase